MYGVSKPLSFPLASRKINNMICYKDMTFCLSDCTNDECFRNYGPQQQAEAKQWWGDMEGEPPIAMSDFSVGCEWYKGVKG